MEKQKELFKEIMETRDEYMFIILDACRYDYLSDLVEERGYPLVVKEVHAGFPNTHSWVRGTWDVEYPITYVSPTPYVSNSPTDGPGGGPAYDGSKHFENVIESWRTDWDEGLGGISPSSLARSADANLSPKMIVHFKQPHMPHIGHPPLINKHIESNNLTEIGMTGEFSDSYIQRSYKGNLELVWDEGVCKLVPVENPDTADRKIVITADHGEALGEDGMYGHNNHSRAVTHVPWIEIG